MKAKGISYTLAEPLGDGQLARDFEGGCCATLRLNAGVYHRFHAPHDCTIDRVTHVPGDAYNVNPPAVTRIDRLYCRKERAVIVGRLRRDGQTIVVVPVAAILVAGIRLRFVDLPRRSVDHVRREIRCAADLARARTWAGSSTARQSSYSRRTATRCAKAWRRERASAPANG